MTIPVVRLKPKEDKRIQTGHPWVFSNEIAEMSGVPKIGDVVEVRNSKGNTLGFGFHNPNTLISVRIFSRDYVEPDKFFFEERIRQALALRERIFQNRFYRLVYGESDFLPGLIVDRFDSLFSVQMLSAAMETRKDLIYQSIQDLFSPKAVYARNESRSRAIEGLPQGKEIICGVESTTDYDEDGVIFRIDPFHGQKTGFYFDQRMNRIFARRFAKNVNALDLYCNEGGFALNLASAGARSVIAVDSSPAAVEKLHNNAALNSITSVSTETADVDAFLEKLLTGGEKFDLIACDPPSFARNRKSVTTAKAAYRRLHDSLFKLVSHGGILLTSSCSYHVFPETFEEVIRNSAQKSGRYLQLLHKAGASPDHPTLPAMPETEYLKFNAYRVL